MLEVFLSTRDFPVTHIYLCTMETWYYKPVLRNKQKYMSSVVYFNIGKVNVMSKNSYNDENKHEDIPYRPCCL